MELKIYDNKVKLQIHQEASSMQISEKNSFVREIIILRTIINSTQNESFDIPIGTKLELKRESDHFNDRWALSVWYNNIIIGYVPFRQNQPVSRLIDAGKKVTAYIDDPEDPDCKVCGTLIENGNGNRVVIYMEVNMKDKEEMYE